MRVLSLIVGLVFSAVGAVFASNVAWNEFAGFHDFESVEWIEAEDSGGMAIVITGEWTGECGRSRQTVWQGRSKKIAATVTNTGSCTLTLSGINNGQQVFFQGIRVGQTVRLEGCLDWVLAYCDQGRERCSIEYRVEAAACR